MAQKKGETIVETPMKLAEPSAVRPCAMFFCGVWVS
jgi:hypothetical protein